MAILARSSPTEKFEKLRKAAEDARKPFEKDWWLNVAFFLGEQYVEWKADSSNIRHIPRDTKTKRRPRPVVNKINHFVSQQHAFALQSKPNADVLPATDDPGDISDALVAKAYLDFRWDTHQINFNRKLSQAALWALVPGQCDLKWCWNQQEQRPDVVVISPFEGLADPYAHDFDQSRYYIHSKFMDRETVYEMYGVDVPVERLERADAMRTQLLREMGSAPVLSGVTVNEIWMKPSRRNGGEGLYAVWSGNRFLAEPRPLPYKHKKLPFTRIGVVPRPGSQFYDSHVKYLRPAQMELNKYHAQRIQIRENFASPKWGVDSQLELEEDPNDEPNQILRYNSQGGALKPELFQPAAMAENSEGQWITEEMMNVVGLHEVSQAQVPGRVEAAKAIELLKEADTSRLQAFIGTVQDAIAHGGWQHLMLAKQYEKPETVVTAYSSEGVPEVRKFMAKDQLQEGMRVRVSMGTGLARSRAARNDQVMTLVQNGILTDPEQVAQMLELPLTTLLSTKAYDVRAARNENLEMSDGNPLRPNSWDDHEIHLREHNNYRKSGEFQALPATTKAVFEMHCQLHSRLQMRMLQQQIQQQAAMQPPPGGGPSSAAGAQPPPAGDTAGQTPPGGAPSVDPTQA